MLRGDFEAAWRICDDVLEQRRGRNCSNWPRRLQYIWDGSPLEDKHVLVRCYHGLGDTIQFVRLLPLLRSRVRRITLWAQPALIGLLQDARGVDQIAPLHDGAPGIEYDADIELMELPHALRLRAADIPAQVPYIYVSPNCRSREVQPGSHRLQVGLVWRGGGWQPQRSIPGLLLRRLAAIPGVSWHSLQYPAERPPFAMVDCACPDLSELAARMTALDLVISVDTMNAHLAGALGLPVWTLLPDECDWRWMAARSDSPWYPTMRLFRQRSGADWSSVIDEVVDELSAAAVSRSRARDTRSSGCTASSG